jgi:hypothetical protein
MTRIWDLKEYEIQARITILERDLTGKFYRTSGSSLPELARI